MGNLKFTARQMIDAIKGSGGIKAAAARRLGCDWRTVDNYIKRYKTVNNAYEEERERVIDLAESIVIQNLQLARKKQLDEDVLVDTGDARWVLTMKGGDRGYAPKQKLEHTGAGGGPIETKEVKLSDAERLAALAAMFEQLPEETVGSASDEGDDQPVA